MEAEAIEKIESLVKEGLGKIVDIDGRKYSTSSLSLIQHDPQPKALEVHGLQGIVDFIEKTFSPEQKKTLIVSVTCPTGVVVYDSLNPETMSRKAYVRAALDPTENSFPFGRFMDNEEFLIGLKSRFKKTKDQETVLAYASKITQGASVMNVDDGVAQSTTINKTLSGALKENAVAPSIVSLQPYRTFREVAQPESEFIFRMKASGDKLPACSLHEADGGAWKLVAIENIAKWLRSKMADVTVIA